MVFPGLSPRMMRPAGCLSEADVALLLTAILTGVGVWRQ